VVLPMTCQHCNTHYEVTTWHAAHGKRKQAFANHSAYSDWGSDASSKRLQSEFDCFNGAKKTFVCATMGKYFIAKISFFVERCPRFQLSVGYSRQYSFTRHNNVRRVQGGGALVSSAKHPGFSNGLKAKSSKKALKLLFSSWCGGNTLSTCQQVLECLTLPVKSCGRCPQITSRTPRR